MAKCSKPEKLLNWLVSLTPEDTITLIEVISAISTLKGTPLPPYVDPGAKLAKAGLIWFRDKPRNAVDKTLNAINAATSASKLSGTSVPSIEMMSKLGRLAKKYYTLKRTTNGVEDIMNSHTGLSELSKIEGLPLGAKHDKTIGLLKLAHGEYVKYSKKPETKKRGKRNQLSP